MEDFQIPSLLLKWNLLNQIVKNQKYHFENICLHCNTELKYIRRLIIELNDNAVNKPNGVDENILVENNLEELKLVEDVLKKAQIIRSNIASKDLIPLDNLNNKSASLIKDSNEKVNSNILNDDRGTEKHFSKEIFPSKMITSKKGNLTANSKILIISKKSPKIMQPIKEQVFNKENKIYSNKLISKNSSRNSTKGEFNGPNKSYKSMDSVVSTTTQPHKLRSRITLVKPVSSSDKINKITKSLNKVYREKEEQLIQNDNSNYCSSKTNFLPIHDDRELNFPNNDEMNLTDGFNYQNFEHISNDNQLNDAILIPKENLDINPRNHLKELKLMNKKLRKNKAMRCQLQSDSQSSSEFISLLEQNNNDTLAMMRDTEANSYKRCLFYSICKQAILNTKSGSNLIEVLEFSHQLIDKISSDITKLENCKLRENYCKNNLENVLNQHFIYPNNTSYTLKYKNLKQIKEFMNKKERICLLKLHLILIENVEKYFIYLLNELTHDHQMYLKCYRMVYSLVHSFGQSSPTLVRELPDSSE